MKKPSTRVVFMDAAAKKLGWSQVELKLVSLPATGNDVTITMSRDLARLVVLELSRQIGTREIAEDVPFPVAS